MSAHREFFNNVSNDVEQDTEGCNCGCGHKPLIQSFTVVAMVNGKPLMWHLYGAHGFEPTEALTAALEASKKENA